MKAEDHLDRAKPLMLTRPVQLSDHALKLYDDFLENFVLSLDDADIEAATGGVLINKLLQFTGGAVLDEDRKLHEVHTDKLDELRELVDELQGEPLMVTYWYKSSLTRLKKAFPHAVVMDRSAKCVGPWNEGKIDMLLVQPAGAAHGLNMQLGPGHDIAFFDPVWSRELYDQVIGRIDRQGQKKVVRVHHLIAQRADDGVKRSAKEREARLTADEIVMAALADKGAGQDALFRFIREMRKRVAARAGSVVKPYDSEGDDL
jgi:SNF2 family DNA or RNA helicase